MMKRVASLAAIAISAWAFSLAMPSAAQDAAAAPQKSPVAETTKGQVQGIVNDKGVLEYRGIPYAADTGGANRFLPPQERAAWTGVRDASQFGPICPQSPPAYGGDSPVSEDCLSLNVYTPGLSGKRPVIVDFHGGAWRAGSGPAGYGTDWARRGDAVVVTTNNRLNAFGHLSLDPAFGKKYESSGNVGMFDLHMAMQWVRDNIARFGGDPANVTVVGTSGGGAKTLHAMAMPIFKDRLFQRAIIFGGHDLWKRNTLASARERSAAIVKELGIKPGDIKALQKVPVANLLAAHDKVEKAYGADPAAGGIPWHSYDLLLPVIDGKTLPDLPIDMLAKGASADVDLMLGTSKMEHWMVEGAKDKWGWLTRDELLGLMKPHLGDRTEAIVSAYEKAMPGASPSSLLHRINTDRDWHLAHLQIAQAKAQGGGKPAYLWFVDAEVITSRAMTDTIAPELLGPPLGWNDFTHASQGQFEGAIFAFAKSGNPNHPGMLTWEPFTAAAPTRMVFGLETQPDKPMETLKIWDGKR